jgi:hypothetical protein
MKLYSLSIPPEQHFTHKIYCSEQTKSVSKVKLQKLPEFDRCQVNTIEIVLSISDNESVLQIMT